MLLISSISVLVGLSSLIFLSSALPFLPHPRNRQLKPLLIPRASYSVVPVDGGAPSPTAGGSPGATTTVIEITTQTPAPQTTLTIVSTDIVPAGTEMLTSTATVTAQDTTEIFVVTVTPAAATVTVTAARQQTITITPPPTVEYTSAAAPSSTSISTMCSISNSTSIPTTISTTSSPTSSKTYDDGFWHTTYPVWSNSSSTTVSVVTLPPTSLA